MKSLLTLFLSNLFPILIIAFIGYLAGIKLNIKAQDVSKVVLYILNPALVFNLLTTSQLTNHEMLKMFLFSSSIMILTGVIAWIIGRLLNLPRDLLAAVVLTSGLINAGNYGFSLNSFAFGEKALPQASIFFVTSLIITNTLGVGVASLGKYSFIASIKSLFTIPTIYAVILSFLFITFNWHLPLPLARVTSTLSDATISMMLIVLGLQLMKHDGVYKIKALTISNTVRLIVSPLLALGLVFLFNIQGYGFKAGMVDAAMPSAVMSIVLATEFDTQPEFVTSAVLISTLLSPFTLTPLLAILGA